MVEGSASPILPPKPPGPPWRPLPSAGALEGVLSFYYSEDEAAVPIRAVMLANNNKSDPNIETATYGLFSTCSPRTRSGIVHRGTGYMFFVTQRHGGRMITGYYRLKWFTPGSLAGHDFAVAADHVHFIAPGIPVQDLPAELRSHCGKRFRLSLKLDSKQTLALLCVLDRHPNQAERYLKEIDRIERRNQHLTGFRYVAWRRTEPFSWEAASLYLPAENAFRLTSPAPRRHKNKSSSDWWKCIKCGKRTPSKALLKLCPWCNEQATLIEDPGVGNM